MAASSPTSAAAAAPAASSVAAAAAAAAARGAAAEQAAAAHAAAAVAAAGAAEAAGGADLPRDAKVLALILAASGVEEVDPKALVALMEFQHRYTRAALEDATVYAAHAGRMAVTSEDIRLAIQTNVSRAYTQPSPREVLIPLAQQKNMQTWATLGLDSAASGSGSGGGVRLPPASECLSARNYAYRAEVDPRVAATAAAAAAEAELANTAAAATAAVPAADPVDAAAEAAAAASVAAALVVAPEPVALGPRSRDGRMSVKVLPLSTVAPDGTVGSSANAAAAAAAAASAATPAVPAPAAPAAGAGGASTAAPGTTTAAAQGGATTTAT